LIFADRATITASIGVVGGKFGTKGLFDKMGVSFHAYQRGKNAGILDSGEPFTPEQKAKVQAWMDEIYATFRNHVTASRGDRLKKPLDELTGGRVFTGAQALELGLIDRIGTLDDAIAHVADLAKLTDYEVRPIPRAKSFLETLLEESSDDERKGVSLVGPGALPIFELAAPYLKALDPARAALVRQALQRLELLQREGAVLMTPEIRFGG
jgi:protease-4